VLGRAVSVVQLSVYSGVRTGALGELSLVRRYKGLVRSQVAEIVRQLGWMHWVDMRVVYRIVHIRRYSR